jgi:hypothetical protein
MHKNEKQMVEAMRYKNVIGKPTPTQQYIRVSTNRGTPLQHGSKITTHTHTHSYI